jgi:hypothetical protein
VQIVHGGCFWWSCVFLSTSVLEPKLIVSTPVPDPLFIKFRLRLHLQLVIVNITFFIEKNHIYFGKFMDSAMNIYSYNALMVNKSYWIPVFDLEL